MARHRHRRDRAGSPARRVIGALGALVLALGGCGRGGAEPRGLVVVYSALDREFAAPVLDAYARKMRVDVRPKFDVESTKTVGLTAAIAAEAARPRCDLFWNNEILNTLRLKQRGLLAPFRPSHAECRNRHAEVQPASARGPNE